ncbi:uncharacterized protein N7484_002027 [Penicillium longicatenatum]|uniref:uncharacterized protein n=1 Tax=Penicillium longicatenatum TaxID=1561947 RepID=UPI002546CD78|nr:uncharacterized protein N7484_002027 [Penicillium longicatenatum]KAJ5658378.1 hypothetical protein N7484_002027 [Penicillium longicatenatum]
MWMCLVFQTLTSFHLDQFLPKDVKSLWAGHHLNVALPLWQGFTDTEGNKNIKEATGGRVNFQHHLKSEDPFVRAWAENARDAFNDIRNSPNPALRKYYRDILEKRLAKARRTWAAKKAKRALQALSGTREKITVSHGGGHVEVKSVSKRLGLDLRHNDTVIIQYHLTATQHPKPYAIRALPTDPASRLGVSICGQDSMGAFHCWLETNGSCNVLKMNSLVDVLEGFSLEQSKNFKRRWFTKKAENLQGQKKQKDHVYT